MCSFFKRSRPSSWVLLLPSAGHGPEPVVAAQGTGQGATRTDGPPSQGAPAWAGTVQTHRTAPKARLWDVGGGGCADSTQMAASTGIQ